MKPRVEIWVILAGAICLFHIALRFWNLTESCLWFDEIFSVHAAEYDWGNLVWFVAQDLIHPPLFYALLKIWMALGGESLLWLRLFPVLFSALALLPFYLLCRRLKLSNPTLALALGFFAASGALVKYAQEVRMYSLFQCLALASLWLFARYLDAGKNFAWLVTVNILLVYTHYFGWLVVLSQIAAVLILRRGAEARRVLLMAGVVFLSFTPWLIALWRAAAGAAGGQLNADLAQNIGWMSKPNARIVFQFIFDLIEPFYYQQSSAEPTSRFFVTVPLLMIVAAAMILYFVNRKSEPDENGFSLLSIFVAVPIAAAFAASWLLPVSVWGTRHLIVVFAPAFILTAKFLAEIRIEWVKNIFLGATGLVFAAAFVFHLKTAQPKFVWCAWEDLAREMNLNEPQTIYAFEDLTAYHFWFALRESDRVQIVKINKPAGIEEDAAYFLPRGFDRVKTIDDFEGDRFFVAFRAARWDESKPPLQNLNEKGYRFGEPKVFEAQGEKAFLVEVKR